MKKIIVAIIVLLIFQNLHSQTYYPFPTDTTQWNSLTWAQWSPGDIYLENSQYQIQGDTVIENIFYNKVYYYYSDNPSPYSVYIGGLREDSLKNIYFYPSVTHLPNYSGTEFPSDTSEYLLYTFDSLTLGMILPINTETTEIKVVDIDSVFLGDTYRKRYKIEQSSLLFGNHYWIEGIGSNKDLFASYSHEFEWELYTLCYTDTLTYYINSPNGEDSCNYWIPLGITENLESEIYICPNPATQTIIIKTNIAKESELIYIYNTIGQLIIQDKIINSELSLNIEGIESGLYIVEIINGKRKLYSKFIKK
ncbi:MAG: T9SS type A sorting domain-containing protein [Bacteroidota bacterium]